MPIFQVPLRQNISYSFVVWGECGNFMQHRRHAVRIYIYIYIRFLIKSLECGRTVSHFSFVVGKMYKSAEEKERQVAWGKGKWRKCANTSVVILDSLLMPPSFLCVIQHWFGGLISCLFISHFDVRNDFNYISPTHIYTFTRPRALRREKIYTFFV